MGTRGIIGFKTAEKEVIIYNHFDSYPEGLGADVLNWIAGRIAASDYETFIGQTKQQVQSMVAVGDQEPTKSQITKCEKAGVVDLSVSNRSTSDWYCLLRGAQGNIEKTLEVGFYEDASEFFKEGTHFFGCEYGYMLDLENEVLNFYDGTTDPKLQIPLSSINNDNIDKLVVDMRKAHRAEVSA